MKEKVSKEESNFNKYRKYLEKLKTFIPNLESVLSKKGFEIDRLSPIKTGSSDNWEEGDSLKVNMSLKPISNKVKFVTFKGYTSSGDGKNKDVLQNKAENLENAITLGTGLTSVSVNPFSFEVKNQNESNSILVDFWVK